MAKSFEQIPHDIIENKNIKGGETKTLLAIMRKCGSEKKTTVSASTLAEMCGISEKTIYRHISKFIKKDLIIKDSGKGKKMSISLTKTITDVMKKGKKDRTKEETKDNKSIDKLSNLVDKMSGLLDKMSGHLDTIVHISNVSRVNTPFNTPCIHPGKKDKKADAGVNLTEGQEAVAVEITDRACQHDGERKSPRRLLQMRRFISTHGIEYALRVMSTCQEGKTWQTFNGIAKEYKVDGYKPKLPDSADEVTARRRVNDEKWERDYQANEERCERERGDIENLKRDNKALYDEIKSLVTSRINDKWKNSPLTRKAAMTSIITPIYEEMKKRGLITKA